MKIVMRDGRVFQGTALQIVKAMQDIAFGVEDFTVPSSLQLWSTSSGKREPLKKMPSFFDASNLEVAQHFASSKDGTKVPYFEVGKKVRQTIDELGGTMPEALPTPEKSIQQIESAKKKLEKKK